MTKLNVILNFKKKKEKLNKKKEKKGIKKVS